MVVANRPTSNYQMCTRCIMDTSDPDIAFDADGVCSHCHKYDRIVSAESYRRKRVPGALDQLRQTIQRKGRGKPYDCIIGVSGGVDSTYVAYITRQLGLRPLAVHLDNGWDSELAVSNIENTLRKLDIDLYTIVLDWEMFRDLQLAFLKASTPDAEIPTDHAIQAALYIVAARQGVQFILGGDNVASEAGGVPAWSQGHGDWKYIKSIAARFGARPPRSFPHFGPLQFAYYTLVRGIKWVPVLDYLDYNKAQAIEVLQKELDWRPYGGKHSESIYTRFYQDYFLPTKFGFNKKRLHLSALVWSGQVSRGEALEEIRDSYYPSDLQQRDLEYVIKKLDITSEEFEDIMDSPPKKFEDYPSYKKTFYKYSRLIDFYHRIRRQ